MGNWISAIFNMGNNSSSDNANPPDGIERVNDSVWELRRGRLSTPKLEIYFFHGLQMGDFQNAFWKTWQSKSRDGPVVWPKEWLGGKFPDARILSVSYNSSAIDNKAQLDMYQLGENLLHDIILRRANICPVVLVGHSLGGIVIKQFVLSAFLMRSKYYPLKHQAEIHKINTFLNQNLKGVFYYSTPHHGSRIAELAAHIPGASPYFKLLKTLNKKTGRINEDFRQQRENLKAKAGAIGEIRPTVYKTFSVVVVEEASARSDIDNFYTAQTDHFDVCKPQDKKTAIFLNLCDFIATATEIQISQADPLIDMT